MAPITKTLVFAAIAAMVSARPLVARGPSPDMVTETAWTTVDIPVTVWVNQQGVVVSTEVPGGNFAAEPTSPNAAPAVTSTTTPVTVAPVQPASPSTTMATTTSAMVQQPQPVVTTTTTPAPVAPVAPASSTPAYSPAPASSAAPASPASGGSSGDASVRSVASSTNTCEGTDQACQGDITYWEGGLGACGWNVDTNSDMEIALPFEFMGTQSNGNPYCGKSLTIMNPTTGQTVQATVGDKCMGCSGRSIDLTQALFNAIGDGCNGRCSGFDWWFN